MKGLLWAGKVFGVLASALAIVKLVTYFFGVGLVGIPRFVLAAYTSFIDEAQRLLVEIPFHIVPPEWVKHAAVIWLLFAGTNWRFLTTARHGENLLTGVGDVGRGLRRGSMPAPVLYSCFVLLTASGPVFSIFVLFMWLGNRLPGPSGQGRWGDRLMIGNRPYTVRISGLYLLILALAPLTAAAFLVWNAASGLPG